MKNILLLLGSIMVASFTHAQNVGIGLTNPTAKLSISANGTELVGTAAGNTLRTNAGSLSTSAGSEISLANIGFLSPNNSSLGIRAYRSSPVTGWENTAILLGMDVDNTVRAGGGFLALSGNGNIGIGTPNPLQKLHVEGATYLNGNVGIGVNTASFPLSFAPLLGDKISLWSNSTNSYGFGIQSTLLQIHTDISAADIAFGYGSSVAFTEVMRIKGNGSVGIGTPTPSATAALDVSSTTKGFLPPRMNSTQRNAISSPATGLTIYNTSNKVLESFDGTAWAPSASIAHYIGESYGGGIVFYVYDNGQHGLIAATADQSSAVQWYNGTSILCNAVRNDGISTGRINTDSIITKQGAGNYAAAICAIYLGGGFGDWNLPSKYELNLLYLQKTVVGGFSNNYYWSSSESDFITAWGQDFSNGVQAVGGKGATARVRAVRAF